MAGLTFHGPILDQVRRRPGRVAIHADGGDVTYGELDWRSARLARGLLGGLGLQVGDRVGLLCRQDPRFYVGLLAIARAGMTLVPIPVRATEREIRHLVADSGMRALILDEELAGERLGPLSELAAEGLMLVPWEGTEIGGASVDSLTEVAGEGADPNSEDAEIPFFLGYTSGTTGAPKAAVVTHRARAALMLMVGQEYGCYTAEDHHLIITPLYHGAGMMRGLAPLAFGGKVTLHPRFDPERAQATFDRGEVTATFMVPTMFAAMQALESPPPSGEPRLTILSNAAALPERLKRFAIGRWPGARLFEIYGSTETGTVTSLRPPDQLRKPRCVGPPLAFNDVRLRGENGAEVPIGEVGELWVRNPFLFEGYLNNEEATAAAFCDGYATVGDLARRDEDGYLYIVDRKVDVIISGGVNVYPREVEEVLREHAAVGDAAVFGRPDERWGETVLAAIELGHGADDPDRAKLERELIEHSRELLAPAKVPKRVAILEALPRTPAGKVKKRELSIAD